MERGQAAVKKAMRGGIEAAAAAAAGGGAGAATAGMDRKGKGKGKVGREGRYVGYLLLSFRIRLVEAFWEGIGCFVLAKR